MAATSVCLILDMDGFKVGGKFYCRELGFASMSRKCWRNSYRFDLSAIDAQMTIKERESANWLKYNLHGLSWKPWQSEENVRNLEDLEQIVQYLYRNSRTESQNYVAYKGGKYEKELLAKLLIPHLNLEKFGCPKYDSLPEADSWNCGYHESKLWQHCPRLKAWAYADWLEQWINDCRILAASEVDSWVPPCSGGCSSRLVQSRLSPTYHVQWTCHEQEPILPPTPRPDQEPILPPTTRPDQEPILPPTPRHAQEPILPPTTRPDQEPILPPTLRHAQEPFLSRTPSHTLKRYSTFWVSHNIEDEVIAIKTPNCECEIFYQRISRDQLLKTECNCSYCRKCY